VGVRAFQPKNFTSIALVCALAMLAAMATTTTAAAQPIKLGAYTPNAPASATVLDEYSQMVGRKPDIVASYKDFFMPLMSEEQTATMKAFGGVPMVSWEPAQPTSGYPAANFGDIAAGKYDTQIREAAKLSKEFGSELMIRFAHEMNISASLWGPGEDGNVGNAYVEAWRHVVSIFRAEGATNVKWVWSPNVDWGGVPFTQYFPGDEWVDYVALDGYNWGKVGTENWQSMQTLFGSSYETLTQLSGKPVIFAETSSGETGGSKAEWIREGFLHTIPQHFSRVYAVVWFNAAAEEDWRIDTSQSALDAYREVVANSLYGGPNPAPQQTSPRGGKKGGHRTTVVKALRVTPSRAPSKSVARSRAKVLFALSHHARVHLVLRRVGSKVRYELTVRPHGNHGRIGLARIARGATLRPGHYQLTAVPLAADGSAGHRHAGFRVRRS
jgi:beta-mannanase